jgi:hypothetical protein
MKDGLITLNSPEALELGFTLDKFESMSYLWKDGDYVWISFIASTEPGKGYLLDLFNKIQSLGLGIKVPTPFMRMSKICTKYGMTLTEEPAGPPFKPEDIRTLYVKYPPNTEVKK